MMQIVVCLQRRGNNMLGALYLVIKVSAVMIVEQSESVRKTVGTERVTDQSDEFEEQ